jgi:hypothetical protein
MRFPIVLRNREGKQLASIYMTDHGQFKWHHAELRDTYANRAFDTLDECIEDVFGRAYQEIVELKKRSEEYGTLQDSLRKALKTPWNNL